MLGLRWFEFKTAITKPETPKSLMGASKGRKRNCNGNEKAWIEHRPEKQGLVGCRKPPEIGTMPLS